MINDEKYFKYFIYLICDLRTGKCYVGRSRSDRRAKNDRRFQEHCNHVYNKKYDIACGLYYDIDHSDPNFWTYAVIYDDIEDKKDADIFESLFMRAFNSIDHGYNEINNIHKWKNASEEQKKVAKKVCYDYANGKIERSVIRDIQDFQKNAKKLSFYKNKTVDMFEFVQKHSLNVILCIPTKKVYISQSKSDEFEKRIKDIIKESSNGFKNDLKDYPDHKNWMFFQAYESTDSNIISQMKYHVLSGINHQLTYNSTNNKIKVDENNVQLCNGVLIKLRETIKSPFSIDSPFKNELDLPFFNKPQTKVRIQDIDLSKFNQVYTMLRKHAEDFIELFGDDLMFDEIIKLYTNRFVNTIQDIKFETQISNTSDKVLADVSDD